MPTAKAGRARHALGPTWAPREYLGSIEGGDTAILGGSRRRAWRTRKRTQHAQRRRSAHALISLPLTPATAALMASKASFQVALSSPCGCQAKNQQSHADS